MEDISSSKEERAILASGFPIGSVAIPHLQPQISRTPLAYFLYLLGFQAGRNMIA
jgi:hypothetical protein